MYVDDEQWQKAILTELRRSQAIVVQPGSSAGVRWELKQIRAEVECVRVLLCLVSYWRNPQGYEDMARVARESLGVVFPRVVPFLDGPVFIYFDQGWQPRVQELSYKCPALWPVTADATDLPYTLQPFVQGMHGGERESPRQPRWARGPETAIAGLLACGIVILVAVTPFVAIRTAAKLAASTSVDSKARTDGGQASNLVVEPSTKKAAASERPIPELVARSLRITLEGRAAPYRFDVPEALIKQPPEQQLVEHSRKSPDNRLFVNVIAHGKLEDLSTFAEQRLEFYVKKKDAESKLEGVRTISLRGVDWIEAEITAKLDNELNVRERIRGTSDSRGTVLVMIQVIGSPLADPIYTRTAQEIFQSFRFVEQPGQSLKSAAATPKDAARPAAAPAKPATDLPGDGGPIVRGSDLKGPASNAENPRGHYVVGNENIRIMVGGGTIDPEPGKPLPAWPNVVAYAEQLDGDLHVLSEQFHYVLLEKGTLLVLKVKNATSNLSGYVLVYRVQDGSYAYTSNGDDNPWRPLPLGESVTVSWEQGERVRLHVEIVRPNLNQDEQDRELDYRFRLEEVANKR